jgi:acetyl-CoA carboxylase biotin carboxyl carrier protein
VANIIQVKAPIAGIFHSAASVGQLSYIEISKEVVEGQILCLLETMKLFTPVKSPATGTITQIMLQDGDSVAKDQVIVHIAAGQRVC